MTRGERRARTEAVVSRRVRDWKAATGSEINDYRRGRSRDRHPLDCGRPHCGVCHSEKLGNHPPIRDVRQGITDPIHSL